MAISDSVCQVKDGATISFQVYVSNECKWCIDRRHYWGGGFHTSTARDR